MKIILILNVVKINKQFNLKKIKKLINNNKFNLII